MDTIPPPKTEPEVFRLEEITVGDRDRQELGDIDALAESIRTVGLLHPIVVTVDGDLVAGDRRMAAVRKLGWSEVPVTVVDLTSAEQVLRAEADENTCRKALTPVEASKARERRARILAPRAAENKGGRPKKGEETSSNLDEVSPAADRATRKVGAVGTGYSGSTLDKVDRIRDAAERGIIRQGRTEKPIPEPVREAAQSALSAVSQTGAVVDREHKRLQAALDEHVQADPTVQQAKYRAALSRAFARAAELFAFDPAEVAAALTEDEWRTDAATIEQFGKWWKRVEDHNPHRQGLRIVGGSDV